MDLYPYQRKAAAHLAQVIQSHGAALDASDTGVGKTFTGLGVAQILNLQLFVVCPKIIRSAWKEAAKQMGVPILDAVNVEKLRTGNTPYLERSGRNVYRWTLPSKTLLFWDEVQNAGGAKSLNGSILAYTKAYHIPTIMASATVADSPLRLKAPGYLLGLHRYSDFWNWCLRNGCYRNRWNGIDFTKGPGRLSVLHSLHSTIFPDRGVRVKIADLPEFPECSTFVEAYDMEEATAELNEVYHELQESLEHPKDSSDSPLVVMLRAQQRAELLRVPLFLELTQERLEEGKSVVIFTNYKASFHALLAELEKFTSVSVVYGDQESSRPRDEEVRRFQANETRVCLCMIQAGGVGVSLHDIHGGHPREALIPPTFNANQLKQALGRIHRAGAQSKAIQRIIFASGTVEEEACNALRRKLGNLSLINDGDLSCGLFDTKEE